MFGFIMGTYVAPISANVYISMLANELCNKCILDPKFKWPILFLRFIDDGFGVFVGTNEESEYWITQFNMLRDTIKIEKLMFGTRIEYMDSDIYKGSKIYECGILDIGLHQ